jgi:hypothetical protein
MAPTPMANNRTSPTTMKATTPKTTAKAWFIAVYRPMLAGFIDFPSREEDPGILKRREYT